MNPATPIPLAVAIVAAGVGGAIVLAVVVRFIWETRHRRQLLSTTADLDGLEDDVLRYVRRVHLLRADWSPRVEPDARREVDGLYDRILLLARELQERRNNGEDVATDVGTLIALEDEMIAAIQRARP